ncbi:hypothetical protein BZA70DRAFT_119581 [Myxozyma melibiosi]|uniref:Uncharacterized protein n=1 Tax=Myxozyma melibiosi TaxID=54550 RepID=A0ABR1FB12_9ASCO
MLNPPPPPAHLKRERFSYLRWNWVWGYVILLALVGSANINIMRQKHVYTELERTYGKKISALERVIEKLKAGKEVDIAEELGTGIPQHEHEWTDLLASLEEQESEIRTLEAAQRDDEKRPVKGNKPRGPARSRRELTRREAEKQAEEWARIEDEEVSKKMPKDVFL